MRKPIILIFLLIFSSTAMVQAQLSANHIIEKAIEKAGGIQFENTAMRFTFRNIKYQSTRTNGLFELERSIKTPEGIIKDRVNNTGLSRTIDNCPIAVVDSLVTRISDGVNSVHYFANLPYGLNAPAVKKELVGETNIKGEPYYKIKVTFDQQGGGTDFEDEFMYWVHQQHFTVDYLAYKYAVNGGGIRFREAYHPRIINGIRFVDYRNYKTDDLTIPLSALDTLFTSGNLPLISTIVIEDIYVYPLPICC